MLSGKHIKVVPDKAIATPQHVVDKINQCRHFWAGGNYRSKLRIETQYCVYCSISRYQINKHKEGHGQWQ